MRILFVTANRVGDAVLSTGILAHMLARHPEASVTIAAGPAAVSLFRNIPQIEQLIVFEKKRYGAHWARLWKQCAGRKWDIVVDLRRSLLAYCLRARNRHLAPKARPELHRVEALAAVFGLESSPPAPRNWPDRIDPPENPDQKTLALAPAANWVGKQWRAERFAEVAERLIAPNGSFAGARVAVFAAASERAQVTPILERLPKDRLDDLVGVGDLATVAARLAHCDLFVGNDSGLMHMAAAAGIPTLGLFGPSRPEHYAPWGPNCAYVRTRESYDELVGAPGYDHRTTGTLMDGLAVGDVLAAAESLLHKADHPET